MIHKPSSLLGHSQSLAEFIRTDAVFHIDDHPKGRKPLVETYRRILEYGSDFGAKLFAAFFTLPDAPSSQKAMLGRVAVRASNAFRPANLNHKSQRVISIGEILDRFQQGLWKVLLVHHEEIVP